MSRNKTKKYVVIEINEFILLSKRMQKEKNDLKNIGFSLSIHTRYTIFFWIAILSEALKSKYVAPDSSNYLNRRKREKAKRRAKYKAREKLGRSRPEIGVSCGQLVLDYQIREVCCTRFTRGSTKARTARFSRSRACSRRGRFANKNHTRRGAASGGGPGLWAPSKSP